MEKKSGCGWCNVMICWPSCLIDAIRKNWFKSRQNKNFLTSTTFTVGLTNWQQTGMLSCKHWPVLFIQPFLINMYSSYMRHVTQLYVGLYVEQRGPKITYLCCFHGLWRAFGFNESLLIPVWCAYTRHGHMDLNHWINSCWRGKATCHIQMLTVLFTCLSNMNPGK